MAATSLAKSRGVRVLADPIRGSDYRKYHGCSAITPNRLEAGLATQEQAGQGNLEEYGLPARVHGGMSKISEVEKQIGATDEKIARIAGAAVPAASVLTAGDILTVVIVEEPLLPREFPVARDGPISFPLLGKISVAGHTAAQVRALLTDRLTAVQPGSQPHVTVSAIRPVKEQR